MSRDVLTHPPRSEIYRTPPCTESWWLNEGPDGFTAVCERHIFKELQADWQARRSLAKAMEQQAA